ncbi:MAG TPA: hypothetical protein VEI01_02500 [Terriglobales bacterium]|nr:hypothetical protein [Terriglobales bacterium]
MELILTAEEQELLVRILEHRHRELQKEISHTDHREFKVVLHRNEEMVESILTRLRGASSNSSAGSPAGRSSGHNTFGTF